MGAKNVMSKKKGQKCYESINVGQKYYDINNTAQKSYESKMGDKNVIRWKKEPKFL